MSSGASTGLGQAAYFRGDYPEARIRYDRAIDESRRVGATESLAQSLADASNLAIGLNDLERAKELVEEAIATYKQIGGGPAVVSCLLILAQTEQLRGDLATSRAHHEEALEFAEELGFESGRAGAELGLAWLVARDGEFERASALARSARDRFVTLDDERSAAYALTCLGEIAVRQQDRDAAIEHYAAALDKAVALGGNDLVQRVFLMLGRTLCSTDRAELGVRLLGSAKRMADEGMLSWDQANTALALDSALDEAKSHLGDRFDEAWQLGATLGIDDAVAQVHAVATLGS